MPAETLVMLLGALALQSMQTPTLGPETLNRLPVAQTVVFAAPKKKDAISLGIDVSAEAAIVLDADSGAVLFEKNANRPLPIASLTKLTSAITYLDLKPDPEKSIQLIDEDNGTVGKAVFKSGETFHASQLFEALLIGSVNQSANALARMTLGRDPFVAAMNKTASRLGMQTAHFTDPAGLNASNKASAHDVATALRAAATYPEVRAAMAKPAITLQGQLAAKPYQIKTTNLLLGTDLNRKPYQIIAAKSGTLPEAGFNFAQITQGPEGQRVIAVVLNDDTHFSRFQDVKALTYWAFQNYEWPHRQARN